MKKDVKVCIDELKQYNEIDVSITVGKSVKIKIHHSGFSDIDCSEFRSTNRRALQPIRDTTTNAELKLAVGEFIENCQASLFGERAGDSGGTTGAPCNLPTFREVRWRWNGDERRTGNALAERFFEQCVAGGRVKLVDFYGVSMSRSTVASLQRAMSNDRCVLEALEFDAVRGMDLGDRLFNAISSAFAANRSIRLKRLTASNLGATEQSIIPFFDALLRHRRIELLSLNLIDNVLTQACLDKAADYVASDVCKLQSLEIGNILLDYEQNDGDVIVLDLAPFCRAMCVNKSITLLDLFSKHSGDAGVAAVCDMLLQSTTLRSFSLYCPCALGDTGSTSNPSPLCDVLRKNNTLVHLDVSGCFDVHHCGLIAGALESGNFTLKSLSANPTYVACSVEEIRIDNSIHASLRRNELIDSRKSLIKFSVLMVRLSRTMVADEVILDIFDMIYNPTAKNLLTRYQTMKLIQLVRDWWLETQQVQRNKRLRRHDEQFLCMNSL